MQEILGRAQGIWDDCARTPFVQEVKKGTLPVEKFREYMIQDSIYLKHYARIFGKAIYHSTTLKEIRMYYAALNFVTDTESVVRLEYLKKFDITDDDIELIEPLSENKNYIEFMVEATENGDICEILMAILPCMLSYCYIFRKTAEDPSAKESQYWDFINDYATDHFNEICNQWYNYADEKCDMLPLEKKNSLYSIFEKGSLLELDFWNMAYRGNEHE
jgi:thiaminase/transcriptional activator TenA